MAEINGFHKAQCDLCNKETWHYKEKGNQPPHCTNHSAWTPNRKRVVPGTVMQAQLMPVHAVPTEREIRVANRLDRSLWRNADSREYAVDITDEAWAKDLFPPAAVVLDPDKLYCSFCGDPVEKVHVLTEKKPTIRKVMDAFKVGDEIVVRERVVTKLEVVHACPKCCLNIRKPIVVRSV